MTPSLLAHQRTYGAIELVSDGAGGRPSTWRITEIEPHVAIRLKQVFPRIQKTAKPPFVLTGGPQLDADLQWFLSRYPMRIADTQASRMGERRTLFELGQAELGAILSPAWQPPATVGFREGTSPYGYQVQAAELAQRTGRLLLMDEPGLGKTVSAIATIVGDRKLPALVVPQTHLPGQWAEKLAEFTELRVHIVKQTTPYELPPADVVICPYSKLAGWIDYAETAGFRAVVFDEIQELRAGAGTAKGAAARAFARQAELVLGLSGTPIYNYGEEIWRICDFLEEGCLGDWWDFVREWCAPGPGGKWIVRDPAALGTFLRENHLALRRTRLDVGHERLFPNTIVQSIETDAEALEDEAALMASLARQVISGTFTERGQAAREFDMRLRQATGIAKAKHVAAFVKILLRAGRPVLLCGWHRECFARGTPVLMADGAIKPVETVRPGDLVMGPDSMPRTVKSLIKGSGQLYRVTPNKGDAWVCSENHILALRKQRKSDPVFMTVKQFLGLSPRMQRDHALFRAGAIDFRTLPVLEPWLVGYWLGNGDSALQDLRVACDDAEPSSEIGTIALRHGLKVSRYAAPGVTGGSSCRHLVISSGKPGHRTANTLLRHFCSLGLKRHKHIPQAYKCAPHNDRRELLAGLIDSDGYVYPAGNSAGTAEFVNKNERLARDVAFVARSLGLAASVTCEDKATPFNSKGARYWRVTISGDLTQIPMRVGRKAPPQRAGQKNVLHTGFRIDAVERDEFFGFEVGSDHLFLLGDFTVVHNCYDIWQRELADWQPALYTGTESAAQKAKTKDAFVSGATNLMIMSLRSGAGLDGLQKRCSTIVFGELDWSPKVHEQCTARLDRPGQTAQVDAIYLVSEDGCDPAIMRVLGLKSSQSHGIVDPLTAPGEQNADATRIRQLAELYLANAPAAAVAAPRPPIPDLQPAQASLF